MDFTQRKKTIDALTEPVRGPKSLKPGTGRHLDLQFDEAGFPALPNLEEDIFGKLIQTALEEKKKQELGLETERVGPVRDTTFLNESYKLKINCKKF